MPYTDSTSCGGYTNERQVPVLMKLMKRKQIQGRMIAPHC